MKHKRITCLAALGFLLALALPASAQMRATDWTWRATIYGWFPSINGNSNFRRLDGGGEINTDVNPEGYLSRLQFAFMGTLEARTGPWSLIGDGIYLNFGNHSSRIKSISGPGGGVAIPIDSGATTNLEGFLFTLAGGYAVLRQPNASADLLAGLRYARLKSSLDWDLSTPAGGLAKSGSTEITKGLTDGIVGARGIFDLAAPWFVPWYVDAGAGSSRFTWQAMAGIGYRFGWGDVTVVYRHLAYDFHSDRIASDISFSGPAVALSFRF